MIKRSAAGATPNPTVPPFIQYRVVGTAIATGIIVVTTAWVFAARRADPNAAWVLPAEFENRTEDAIFDHTIDAALTAGLEQSSYVNVLPRARVQQALTRMGRTAPALQRFDESVAREVAQREGVRVVIGGAIDRVDSTYVISAHLVDATSGADLGAERSIARRRPDVINAVDDLVRRLRRRIGESAQTLAKHDRPLPRATTPSLEALKKYADASRAFVAGQRTAALGLWEDAVAIDSDFALAHAELGAAYYFGNNRPRGDAHFSRALALLDRLTDRERFIVRASAESWRGNRERAIEIRKAYVAEFPDDMSEWSLIGYDYLRLNRDAEAVDAFERRLARDSDDAATLINLATAHKALGNYDDAIRAYHRAFAAQPNYLTVPNLNHEYGGTFALAGRFGEARAVFDTMASRSQREQRAQGERSIGLLSIFQGQYLDGIVHLRRAVALTEGQRPGLSAMRNRLFLAAAEREVGWTDSARTQLRAAYALFRTAYVEPGFLMHLGRALARDGQLALASEVLDSLVARAKADNPDDQAEWQLLAGEIALASGRADSAAKLLRPARGAELTAVATDALARALAATRDLIGAAQLYESNAKQLPRSFGAENQFATLAASRELGAIYERLGDPPRARNAYEQMLSQWQRPDSGLMLLRDARAGLARLASRQSGPAGR